MTDEQLIVLGRLLQRMITQTDTDGYGGYRHWEMRAARSFLILDTSVNITPDEFAALELAAA